MHSNSFMVKQYRVEDDLERSAFTKLCVDDIDTSAFFADPLRHEETSLPEYVVKAPAWVHLNLEDLKCFEVVHRQFQHWGVTFNNCIAIHPSNPAFPAHSGSTVLMGAPKNGHFEAVFHHPVQCVNTFVTTSQKLVLSAYDCNNHLLTQVEISQGNLAGSDSQISPNIPLTLKAANIHRISFCAFDGQFTLDDFSFQL